MYLAPLHPMAVLLLLCFSSVERKTRTLIFCSRGASFLSLGGVSWEGGRDSLKPRAQERERGKKEGRSRGKEIATSSRLRQCGISMWASSAPQKGEEREGETLIPRHRMGEGEIAIAVVQSVE
jgi:hypothetical protein